MKIKRVAFREQRMYKNETIEIKPGMNGFRVNYDYRVPAKDKELGLNYDYVSEDYFFTTWDDVVKFVSEKKLETPPAKIN